MTDERHTAHVSRVAAVREKMGRIGVLKLVAWATAAAGFVVYLVNLDSFMDAYGGVGTGLVLVLWVTLFSVLYHATSGAGRQAPAPPVPVSPQQAEPPVLQITERVDLVVTPSAALRNPVAQGRMMSVLGPRAAGLSEREVDMMDWGFAFGVAWAVAREQDPVAAEELVSLRALDATQAVYAAYRGSPAPVMANGGGNGSAAHAHAHAGRASDAGDLRPQDEPSRPARQGDAL
jgi:hypothetical protein